MAPDTGLEKYAREKALIGTFKVLCGHLIVFMVVISTLLAASSSKGDSWWVRWLFIGWRLGVIAHIVLVISPTSASTRACYANGLGEEIATRS